MCVYDNTLLAGQDIQYRAPDSWSKYTTPFNEIINNILAVFNIISILYDASNNFSTVKSQTMS